MILVGALVDEPAQQFTLEARNTLLTTTGVDLRSLVYRGKFVFAAQIGRPQKAQYELRDHTGPAAVAIDVLIRGQRRLIDLIYPYSGKWG